MNTDIKYTFELSQSIQEDYKFSSSVINWLTGNMESLTDDNDNAIFSKVNTGFNEETLKSFGGKPVVDIYINNVDYDANLDEDKPEYVNTILIFYMKGSNNNTYNKACDLHDFIMQEFLVNKKFKRLSNIVRDTTILNSEIQPRPIGKKWGVMGIFELSHSLY